MSNRTPTEVLSPENERRVRAKAFVAEVIELTQEYEEDPNIVPKIEDSVVSYIYADGWKPSYNGAQEVTCVSLQGAHGLELGQLKALHERLVRIAEGHGGHEEIVHYGLNGSRLYTASFIFENRS